MPEPNVPNGFARIGLNKIIAILTIAGMLIGAIFWVANVSATASHAEQSAIKALDEKAGKEDIQRIEQEIKEIRDFLLNGRVKP